MSGMHTSKEENCNRSTKYVNGHHDETWTGRKSRLEGIVCASRPAAAAAAMKKKMELRRFLCRERIGSLLLEFSIGKVLCMPKGCDTNVKVQYKLFILRCGRKVYC